MTDRRVRTLDVIGGSLLGGAVVPFVLLCLGYPQDVGARWWVGIIALAPSSVLAVIGLAFLVCALGWRLEPGDADKSGGAVVTVQGKPKPAR
jgi:hypothetical protein